MRGTALVITDGLLADSNAKTAHGLLRGSRRFTIAGVVDHVHAGQDASTIVPHVEPGVPIFASISEAMDACSPKPEILIFGVATKGGVLSDTLRAAALEAIRLGLHVVNGLHDTLENDDAVASAAKEAGTQIYDIRKPKPFRDLHFWSGSIDEVDCPIIAVLGLDCATGKRTTARLLCEALEKIGKKAEMIYTGQTGWMLGYDHGFIFDSTPNDFVSGEMEHAIVSCWQEKRPDFILVEGQSSLHNPSGPCGPEYLLSANAKAVILQVPVGREKFIGFESLQQSLPPLEDELELIRAYGSETIAIGLNSRDAAPGAVEQEANRITSVFTLPAVNPFTDSQPIINAILEYETRYRSNKGAS